MLVKECQYYIQTKKSSIYPTMGFSDNLIQKFVINNKSKIIRLDANNLTIEDYIQLGCIIDYFTFKKILEKFKLLIRAEKINKINNG
jgi:hypothetical protein